MQLSSSGTVAFVFGPGAGGIAQREGEIKKKTGIVPLLIVAVP
jgi:hypothetical protein